MKMEKDVQVAPGDKGLTEGHEEEMVIFKPYQFSLWSALIGVVFLTIGINGVYITNWLFTTPLPGAAFFTYIPSALGFAFILFAVLTGTVQYAHQLKKTS